MEAVSSVGNDAGAVAMTGPDEAASGNMATAGPGPMTLPSPWMRHELFGTVKKICSAPDGLLHAKKTTVTRLMQELKKGRTYVDEQLAQLEAQLLHVSDFVDGRTATLDLTSFGVGGTSRENGLVDGAAPAGAAKSDGRVGPAGKQIPQSTSEKTNLLDPVSALVEEDLASDAPCTTVGLWRFLSVGTCFKTVTLEDMEEALQLEDPSLVASVDVEEDEVEDVVVATAAPPPASEEDGGIEALAPLDVDKGPSQEPMDPEEVLRSRLLGALLPEVRPENVAMGDMGVDGSAHEENGMKMDPPTLAFSKTKKGHPEELQLRLRDVGLLEVAQDELVQALRCPGDDEVSSEIRCLQHELVLLTRANNEHKRTLRRSLERLKPWLSNEEEHQQLESKFLKMWRRKKELQRKRKHKAKKQMRKEVMNLPQSTHQR